VTEPRPQDAGPAGWLVWCRRNYIVLIWCALVAAIGVRNLAALATVPPGFYADEASVGYNAWALAHFGVDEHGVAFPLFPEAFGDYKNPVYVYAVAGLSRLFGISVLVERLPAALFGLVACVLIALTVRRLTRSEAAALSTLLLAGLTPWLTQESRVGFEVISMVALLGLMTWCLAEAVNRGWRWYLGAGAAAGTAVFAYSTARLEVGLLTVALVLAHLLPWRRRWWTALPPLVIAYAALGWWILAHPGTLTARYNLISITRDHPSFEVARQRFLDNYWQYLKPDFLFIHGDSNPRHNSGWGGMLLWVTLPLLVAGALWCLRHVLTALPRMLLLWVPVAPVAAALIDSGTPNALRSATMLPALLIIAGCGVHGLTSFAARFTHRLVGAGVVAAVVAETLAWGTGFTIHLFTVYPHRGDVRAAFEDGQIDAIVAAHRLANGNLVYLVGDAYRQPSLYIDAAFGLLPPPPPYPSAEARHALLGKLGMIEVSELPPGVQSGDVVVEWAFAPPPEGLRLVYSNHESAIYVR
jgi:4-amino-4-deoxy-L-arabinose transferase-like glycosyltransferase